MPSAEGVRRIPLPTRLPIGTVNVYLLEGDPLTLVDTGPGIDEAYEALNRGLREAGYGVGDLGRILITHGHVDHYGLARRLREDSGAEVWAPEVDHRMVEDFHATYARRRARYREVLVGSGAPAATLHLVEEFFAYLATLGEGTSVDRVVRDGDVVDNGRFVLKAVRTPGHSSGSTCYLLRDGRVLAGDTLIQGLTPIAAFGSADGTGVGLEDYLASLRRLRDMTLAHVLPGHRDAFGDVPGYVDGLLAAFRARQGAVLDALKGGSATAWDLVGRLFGPLPIEEVFLGLTEVLGHLEILEKEGAVAAETTGRGRAYRLARGEKGTTSTGGSGQEENR
jgi:glyoxylase-like metal-dependent hydrolase (beta-lactamase superfamily II)